MDITYLCIRKIYNINMLFFLNNIKVRRDFHFCTSKQNPMAILLFKLSPCSKFNLFLFG